jgi:hypothetical protein
MFMQSHHFTNGFVYMATANDAARASKMRDGFLLCGHPIRGEDPLYPCAVSDFSVKYVQYGRKWAFTGAEEG